MTYKIRRIDEAEFHDDLVDMQKICLSECKPLAPEYDWWIVFRGKEPCGFACLKPSVRWKLTGYLARAGVLPLHRGHGLQRRLINVREQLARRAGWQWLVSDTNFNPTSANNLIRCGFKLYEPEVKWSWTGAQHWRKYIARPGSEVKCEAPH